MDRLQRFLSGGGDGAVHPSFEQFKPLLDLTHPEVVIEALQNLQALSKKRKGGILLGLGQLKTTLLSLAQAWGSKKGGSGLHHTKISILSFSVLVQSSDSGPELELLLENDPDYTNELVRIARSDETGYTVREMSMNAITAQLAASGSSQRISSEEDQKLFATMLEQSFGSGSTVNVQFEVALVRHLLVLVKSCSDSGNVSRCYWLLAILLPIIRESDKARLPVACLAAKTVNELLHSGRHEALELLKSFNGDDILLFRLRTEVEEHQGSSLIKVLLKAAAYLDTYIVFLPKTILQIFPKPETFGPGVYHAAAIFMCSLIDDPNKDAFVAAFLSSAATGMSPLKHLCCVPKLLRDICENDKHLEAVKNHTALQPLLQFLVDAFTSKSYLVSNIEDIRSFACGVKDLLLRDSSFRVTVVDRIIHNMSKLVRDTSLHSEHVLILVKETIEKDSQTRRKFVADFGIELLFQLLLSPRVLQSSEGISTLVQGFLVFKCLARQHLILPCIAKMFCSHLKEALKDLNSLSLFRIKFLLYLAAVIKNGKWATALRHAFLADNSVLKDISRLHREALRQIASIGEEVDSTSQSIQVKSDFHSFKQLLESKLPDCRGKCKILYEFTLNLDRQLTSSSRVARKDEEEQISNQPSWCDKEKVLKQITYLFLQHLGNAQEAASAFSAIVQDYLGFRWPGGSEDINYRYTAKAVEFIDGLLHNRWTSGSCNHFILKSLHDDQVIHSILKQFTDASEQPYKSSTTDGAESASMHGLLASCFKLLDNITTRFLVVDPSNETSSSSQLSYNLRDLIGNSMNTTMRAQRFFDCSYEFTSSVVKILKNLRRASPLSTCQRVLQMKDFLTVDTWKSLVFHFVNDGCVPGGNDLKILPVLLCKLPDEHDNASVVAFLNKLLCDHCHMEGTPSSEFAILALMLKEDVIRQDASKLLLVEVTSKLLSKSLNNRENSQVPPWVKDAFVAIDLLAQNDHLNVKNQEELIMLACGFIKKPLPYDTVQAVLELCATILSKTPSIAVKFFREEGLLSLVSLPASSQFVGFDNTALTIIDHILKSRADMDFSRVTERLIEKIELLIEKISTTSHVEPSRGESFHGKRKSVPSSSENVREPSADTVFILEALTKIVPVSEWETVIVPRLLPLLDDSGKKDNYCSQKLAMSVQRCLVASYVQSTATRRDIFSNDFLNVILDACKAEEQSRYVRKEESRGLEKDLTVTDEEDLALTDEEDTEDGPGEESESEDTEDDSDEESENEDTADDDSAPLVDHHEKVPADEKKPVYKNPTDLRTKVLSKIRDDADFRTSLADVLMDKLAVGVTPPVSTRMLKALAYLASNDQEVAKIVRGREHASTVLLKQPHVEQLLHLLDVIIEKAGPSSLTTSELSNVRDHCVTLLQRDCQTDNAYTLASEVLKKSVAVSPVQTPPFIEELYATVLGRVKRARAELRKSGEKERVCLFSISGSYGNAILRILRATRTLCEGARDILSKLMTEIRNLLDVVIKSNYAEEDGSRFHPGGQNLLPYIKSFVLICEMVDPSSSSDLVSFSDDYRVLLNDFICLELYLLEESFAPLQKVPGYKFTKLKDILFRSKIKRNELHKKLKVSRDDIVDESFKELFRTSLTDLRGRLSVKFKEEIGQDAGGLGRDWFTEVSKALFGKDKRLFRGADDGTCQPNPDSEFHKYAKGNHLTYFRYAGRLVGKAVIDSKLLKVRFTRPFYKHILGMTVTGDDMKFVDGQHYKNLEDWDPDVGERMFIAEPGELRRGLGFEGVELIPGGADICVTKQNKPEYLRLLGEYCVTKSIRKQTNAFLKGFRDLIPRELISIYNVDELELLISGSDVDLSDMKQNTSYEGFTPEEDTILWFWEVVEELDKEDRGRLLRFVTGSYKVPSGGFSALEDGFTIAEIKGGDDRNFPKSATCTNMLMMPKYRSKEVLKEMLKMALENYDIGFHLA